MTISTGGVLRLNKDIMEKLGAKPGDRVIVMQDTESSSVAIQIQRKNQVIALLDDAELVQP